MGADFMQAGIINGARQGAGPAFDAPPSDDPPSNDPQQQDSAGLSALNASLAVQKNAAILATLQRTKMDGQGGSPDVPPLIAADNAAASVPAFSLSPYSTLPNVWPMEDDPARVALTPMQLPYTLPNAAFNSAYNSAPASASPAINGATPDTDGSNKDHTDADPATPPGQTPDNPDAYNGPGTDPNLEGALNQQHGGSVKPAHPVNSIPDQTILDGRADPVNYATATIDRDNKVINIAVKVNYEKTFILNPTASRVSDEEYQRLVGLANAGMEKYWSRSVELDGQQYQVHVTAVNDKDGMPITVAHPGWSIFGDNISSRSYNAWPIHEGTIYYTHEQDRNDDADFARTAAHEIGHGFLTNAFGIGWSWGHEGTSSMLGGMHSDVDPYPASGEIGLMPYYGGIPPWDYYNRSVASENDVKTLLYIAGRRN